MLPANTAASLATFTMVAACALGIGFMVRFFIALAGDGNKMRSGYRTRPKGVRSAADAPCKELLRSETAVNPSGHLAMGSAENLYRSRLEFQPRESTGSG